MNCKPPDVQLHVLPRFVEIDDFLEKKTHGANSPQLKMY